jgi:diaminopimelate decarboxylase
LSLEGVSCHIGSQITDIAPMLEVFDKMIALVERLRARGLPIRTLDLGGGLGVAYKPATKRHPFASSFRPCAGAQPGTVSRS